MTEQQVDEPSRRGSRRNSAECRAGRPTIAKRPARPGEAPDVWAQEALSTRLFPKHQGADKYEVTGLAACCDWVLLSDWVAPHTHVVRHVQGAPRSIFVSMRNPEAAIPALAALLQGVQGRRSVAVIIASEDWTFPVQTDRRWDFYSPDMRRFVVKILASPVVRSIHVENLDTAGLPRVHPLPLGMVFDADTADRSLVGILSATETTPIESSPPTAFCGHRIREGRQWERRRKVSDLARGAWAEFCTLAEDELSEEAFFAEVLSHSFVLCVEGGGLDPSPKAWQTLAHGRIPVIRRSPCAEAYADLPVLFVEDWSEDALSPAILARAKAELAPHFRDPARRERVLQRLTLDYWCDRILGDPGPSGDLSPPARSALSAS